MKVSRIALIYGFGLAILAGCAKTEDEPVQANSKSTTQPAATDNATAKAQPAESAESAPTASVLLVNHVQQWFPPARLRLSKADGKVVARLYSDDPKDILSGKETVNSYDMQMVLNISDPAAISNAVWVNQSSSMDRQDHPKVGIFLDTQQEVLQPMDVKVTFINNGSRVKAIVQGTFALFHLSDQMPNSAPEVAPVIGVLDATVREK